MKKLVMLVTLGLVAPMFGARPILQYGDVNPITGKIVGRYREQATEKLPLKPVRVVNKGKLVKIAEEEELFTPEERMLFMQEEQEMLPERRTGFVDEKGQPLPPALPPRPTTKHATKELNAQDLQNLKLRPASTAGKKEALMAEQRTGQKEIMVKRPFSRADLKKQRDLLKKPADVRPMSTKESSLRESLEAGVVKRRGSISGSEQEDITEEWE